MSLAYFSQYPESSCLLPTDFNGNFALQKLELNDDKNQLHSHTHFGME